MPYEDKDKKPDPRYVVVVQVREVTPAYRTGNGVAQFAHEREVNDLLSLSVQRDSEEEAARLACQMIEQWAGLE